MANGKIWLDITGLMFLLFILQICHSPFFVNSAMILFLNKKDRFAEKLSRSPIKNYFPNYAGENNFREASTFVWGLFMESRGDKVSISPTFYELFCLKVFCPAFLYALTTSWALNFFGVRT